MKKIKNLHSLLSQRFFRGNIIYRTQHADADKEDPDLVQETASQQFHQRLAQNQRTENLLNSLSNIKTEEEKYKVIKQLKDHVIDFPHTRITAYKGNAIKQMKQLLKTVTEEDAVRDIRITLALLGSVENPKYPGVRLLSIDGGGCRGIVSIQIIRKLVEISGKPLHELFDYICGVSTGAVIAFMFGLMKYDVDKAESIYRNFSSKIFSQNKWIGTGKLMMSHAFYDTETYQLVLKEIFGDEVLIDSAADITAPKCSAVSVLVNRDVLKPFVWRNYSIVPGSRETHWPGTCRARLWEAVRATSAAPGYFEEFKYNFNIHQDGGILANNPSGVGLFECRSLWPDAPIQCMVSLGTGRYEPFIGPNSPEFLSLKNKLLKILDSATGTSEVHTILYNLLPRKTYFRFNPFIREQLYMDEYRPEKLDQLVDDTNQYIHRNKYKFEQCVELLLKK
ncbi:calcium-independent phospholipase A2-gamma-like isoform X1 [Styela clava]